MRPGIATTAALAAAVALAVLGRGLARSEARAARAPRSVVDSILPPGEALRRFRIGVAPVHALDGASSRDELLRRFEAAVARGDSAALRALAVNRAEFAWLVYPESRISRPPYNQPPDVAWLTLDRASESGLRRLLSRAPRFGAARVACADSGSMEGRMRITTGCIARVREGGAPRDLRLFGRLVALDGRWKIVAYDGDL